MSAQRGETTRPDEQAAVVTSSVRSDCQALASLKNSADTLSEIPPLSGGGVLESLSPKEFGLTRYFLDRSFCSRLSLRLT